MRALIHKNIHKIIIISFSKILLIEIVISRNATVTIRTILVAKERHTF